jgi:hypothetical protein
MRPAALLVLPLAALLASPLRAQENYEIQVYPSKTADPHTTLFELHSNFTGSGGPAFGVLRATNHALHETLEITHGFSSVFELGFYLFGSDNPGDGFGFVGTHIRPRIRAPESWKLPVGLSLSTEFGPTRKQFDQSELGIEVRPIVDQTVGRLYWAFNPNVEWSMKGPESGKGVHGMNFNPNVKLAWQANPKVAVGAEYYGTTGSLVHIAPGAEQSHMLYPSIDLFLSPDWEFNAGYGLKLSGAGDQNILKIIVGRRLKH